MKFSRPLLAFTLLIFVGAALWGANWRLDHPPFSAADKRFRALVAGAGKVEIGRMSWPPTIGIGNPNRTLDAAQTRALIERLRFVEVFPSVGTPLSKGIVLWSLKFRRAPGKAVYFTLAQTPQHSVLTQINSAGAIAGYKLHPRFEKPLRAYLEKVGPRP